MSAPSSAGSAGSTSGSNVRECELCGSASRTLSAGGSLRSTGPGSRVIPTCAPLWPTPGQGDGVKSYMNPSIMRRVEQRIISGSRHVIRKDGGTYQESLPERVAYLEMTNGCPCRCHTSMSSAEGSPAKTSPTPAREQGSTGNARVFGPSTPDSFANFDPDTSSWRTSQLSLLEDSGECLLTWPRAGMTRNGIASRLRPLAPLTGGTASGLLPTPVARDDGKTPEAHMAMKRRMPGGERKTITSLSVLARNGFRQANGEQVWPTPTANRWDGLQSHGVNAISGSLNPTWVEWLMGFPLGWTDLEHSGTPSSPRSQSGSDGESSSGKAA
jgi:hypothetical protein